MVQRFKGPGGLLQLVIHQEEALKRLDWLGDMKGRDCWNFQENRGCGEIKHWRGQGSVGSTVAGCFRVV